MNIKIKTAVVSDKGLNRRYTVNEDSYLIMEEDGIYAVADGVGGAHAGDVASQTALDIIKKATRQFAARYTDNKIEFLEKLIKAGNNVVYQKGLKATKQMGSTIAMMLISENYAVLAHVGDSRIYIVRQGHIHQLTKDHSLIQEMLDENPDDTIELSRFVSRNAITRALGVDSLVEPELQKVVLKTGDVFIICSDGIYTHNSDQEMLDNVERNKHDLQQVCDTLRKTCYKRGANDNLTAIVLKVD